MGNYPQSHLKPQRWAFCYALRLWVILFSLTFLDSLKFCVCCPSLFRESSVAGCFCPSSAVKMVYPRASGFLLFLRKSSFPNQSTDIIQAEFRILGILWRKRSFGDSYIHILGGFPVWDERQIGWQIWTCVTTSKSSQRLHFSEQLRTSAVTWKHFSN